MELRHLIPQATTANVQKTPISARSVEDAPSNDYHGGQPNRLLNCYINGTFPTSMEEWERLQTTTANQKSLLEVHRKLHLQRNKKGLDIQIILIYRHFSLTL